MGLVQRSGASTTDLIPTFPQSTADLDHAIRATAEIRLAAGLDLKPVGYQYYATILAVTRHERSSLSTVERDALSKALIALGWRATEVGLLCTPELQGDISSETLSCFVLALNAEAVVLLERNLLFEPLRIPWVKVAVCDDFFGSLGDKNRKRTAWIQLKTVRYLPALTD